jgi:hypothetical protein
MASASISQLGKLDTSKKLKGNKTAKLIILEKLEVEDTQPVSIAKKSPAITKTAKTVPDSSIKKLDDEFKKYKSNVDSKKGCILNRIRNC